MSVEDRDGGRPLDPDWYKLPRREAKRPIIEQPVIETRPASELSDAPVEWLEPGYIVGNAINFLEGEQKVGKTTLACRIAAAVSQGMSFLTGEKNGDAGGVLFFDSEDPENILKGRLSAAGADLESKVRTFTEKAEQELFRLADDAHLGRLEATIRLWNARLVIVSPFDSFIGCNADRNYEVRPVLAKLKSLAGRTSCTFLCIRHWGKPGNVERGAKHRGLGSTAITAAARSVLVVGRPNKRENKYVMSAFGNLAKDEDCPSRWFAMKEVNGHPVVDWLDEECNVHADDVARPSKPTKLDEAKAFLRDVLSDGKEVLVAEVERLASERGISEKTLERARKDLGVVSRQIGFQGSHYLNLPGKETP